MVVSDYHRLFMIQNQRKSLDYFFVQRKIAHRQTIYTTTQSNYNEEINQ